MAKGLDEGAVWIAAEVEDAELGVRCIEAVIAAGAEMERGAPGAVQAKPGTRRAEQRQLPVGEIGRWFGVGARSTR